MMTEEKLQQGHDIVRRINELKRELSFFESPVEGVDLKVNINRVTEYLNIKDYPGFDIMPFMHAQQDRIKKEIEILQKKFNEL